MGFFETFYAGPVQHPWLLWLAGVAGVAFALTRPGLAPELRRYLIGLGALTLLDAWLTSNDIPGIGSLPTWASSAVPLFFVLAGDLRYLLVVQCGAPGGRLAFTPGGIAGALGLMLVVPIASQLVVPILAGPEATPRVLFLVYELAFFGLTATLMAFHSGTAVGRWPRVVSRFVLLYYGLWACADAIILLTGADVGFALRVVPNVLYYGGLIAVMGHAGTSDTRSNR